MPFVKYCAGTDPVLQPCCDRFRQVDKLLEPRFVVRHKDVSAPSAYDLVIRIAAWRSQPSGLGGNAAPSLRVVVKSNMSAIAKRAPE